MAVPVFVNHDCTNVTMVMGQHFTNLAAGFPWPLASTNAKYKMLCHSNNILSALRQREELESYVTSVGILWHLKRPAKNGAQKMGERRGERKRMRGQITNFYLHSESSHT